MPVVDLHCDTGGSVPLWRFPGLDVPGLNIAVTGRRGGVSDGPYKALNLGTHVDDNPFAVALNALMLSGVVDGDSVAFVRQVHGRTVIDADDITPDSEADAIVLRSGCGAAGIRVADCVPLAIIDPVQRVCVLVHAGWRGLAANIIEAAAERIDTSSEQLIAVVGPSISGAAYQVGPEVISEHSDFERHAQPDLGDRYLLDLRGVTAQQLERVGISAERQWISRDVTDGGATFFSDRAERPCGRFALIAKWES